MTKQQLIQKLTDIEWEDFEVKLAKGGVPKSAWESVSSDRRATKEEIDTMYRNQSFGTKTSETIDGFGADDLSPISLQQYKEYLQAANPTSHYNKLSIEEFLHKVSVLVDGKLTYAGLLFFGKRERIERHFVDFRIDLFEIPGSSITDAKVRYTYRLPEQENLWDYFFILFERVTMRIDKPFKLDNTGFAKEDYPYIDALREALVNMLMHADYFSPIKSRVRIFNDKIEFFNAGAYPKPVEYFLQNDTSMPRNPILAKLFRAIKLAENAGYGFDKMIEGWKTYTSIPILFQTELDTSTTVFDLHVKTDQANDQAIVEFCQTPKSASEIMRFLGMSHKTYFRNTILNPMLEQGLLELTIPDRPKSPNQKYRSTGNLKE